VTNPDWGDMAGAGFDGFNLSQRDHALFLVGERDLDAQLIAIRGVLRRHREAVNQVAEDKKKLDSHIRAYAGDDQEYQMHMEDQWGDTLHGTVFQDAAHSMSAVGMLAPFVESLFASIFHGLRERAPGDAASDPRAKATRAQYWNPQIVFGKDGPRDDIVAGIEQLATSTGLQPYLSGGFAKAA